MSRRKIRLSLLSPDAYASGQYLEHPHLKRVRESFRVPKGFRAPGLRPLKSGSPGLRATINRALGLQEFAKKKKRAAGSTVKNIRAQSSKTMKDSRILDENFRAPERRVERRTSFCFCFVVFVCCCCCCCGGGGGGGD